MPIRLPCYPYDTNLLYLYQCLSNNNLINLLLTTINKLTF